MRTMIGILCGGVVALLAGCASSPMQEPQIQRISPEELERMSELVRSHMEGVVELKVPLVVDLGVGSNWLDAKR